MLKKALMLACVLSASNAQAAWPNSADRLSKKLVFAEFHPWVATPAVDGFWARWDETGHKPNLNDIESVFWPLDGLYSEGDCATIKSQSVDLNGNITAAGIDVLIIDWVNVYQNEQQRVEKILSCTTTPAVVMVDQNWTVTPSFQEVITRLETVIGWYASKPDLYPTYYRDPATGAPVFIVFDPASAGTTAQWNAKIDYYKTLSPKGIFIAGLSYNTSAQWVLASHFDGAIQLAGKTAASDESAYESTLSVLHGPGSRNQFLIGEAIPGFDDSANCYDTTSPILDRQAGVVFDTKWAGLLNTNWNGHKLDGAYVMYNNDGESAGIEPASPIPPTRAAGFESCNGRVSNRYKTYAPLPATYYLDRNAFWAHQFRSSP
jgi:hypothetical protein